MRDHLTLEQLSDFVDDQAADEARAHVGNCDLCGSALARMRAARRFVGEEVALPAGVLDTAVAAGVSALGPTNVAPLTARRRPNPLPWIAGVAAVLAGVLGLAALVNGGAGRDADTFATGSADDETAAVAEDASEPGGGAGGAASGGESADGLSAQRTPSAASDGRTGAAPPPARSFTTQEEVVDYLQQSAEAMSTTATACSAEATTLLEAPIERLRSEDVTWQDGAAALWVDPTRRRAVVMRPGGCSLLADLRY